MLPLLAAFSLLVLFFLTLCLLLLGLFEQMPVSEATSVTMVWKPLWMVEIVIVVRPLVEAVVRVVMIPVIVIWRATVRVSLRVVAVIASIVRVFVVPILLLTMRLIVAIVIVPMIVILVLSLWLLLAGGLLFGLLRLAFLRLFRFDILFSAWGGDRFLLEAFITHLLLNVLTSTLFDRRLLLLRLLGWLLLRVTLFLLVFALLFFGWLRR